MSDLDLKAMREAAEAANTMLTNGKAKARVVAQILRNGFAAQCPPYKGTTTPDADAAFIVMACANVLALLDRLAAETARADRAENIAKAVEGRVADYRTVAINQGWNWAVCDAYGREKYAKWRGELVDACALNAAETRARAALKGDDHAG